MGDLVWRLCYGWGYANLAKIIKDRIATVLMRIGDAAIPPLIEYIEHAPAKKLLQRFGASARIALAAALTADIGQRTRMRYEILKILKKRGDIGTVEVLPVVLRLIPLVDPGSLSHDLIV